VIYVIAVESATGAVRTYDDCSDVDCNSAVSDEILWTHCG